MRRAAKSSRGEAEQADHGKPKRIFGLSIDERIRCAALTLPEDLIGRGIHWSDVKSDEHDEWELPPGRDVDIHKWLRARLELLKKERPALFAGVQAIGVSCIGVIVEDGNGVKCLSRIYRKPHWLPRPDGFVINFNELFADLFDVRNSLLNQDFLLVRNDATAKAVSEAAYNSDAKYPFVFINLDVGMNCGILVGYGKPTEEAEVFKAALHPEFGHARPARHPDDRFIDLVHSGCPVHPDCYEALASGGRFKARWGDYKLDDNHEQWEFVSYYVAQACFSITMLMAPFRIVIGGYLSSDWLVERIRDEFDILNNGYIPHANADKLIRQSSVDPRYFDILGGLQVALPNPWRGRLADWSAVSPIDPAKKR